MQWGVLPALERARITLRSERQLTMMNTVLGITALLFTAIATAI